MPASLRSRSVAAFAALVVAFGLVAGAASPGFAQAQTPGKGSALRAAILDALRPAVIAEVGGNVEFVVEQMRVLGEWAFVLVRPQRPGAKSIEYVYTRYQAAIDSGGFDNQAVALLRQTPRGWLVYEYRLGFTDVPWVEWQGWYPVPAEVFP